MGNGLGNILQKPVRNLVPNPLRTSGWLKPISIRQNQLFSSDTIAAVVRTEGLQPMDVNRRALEKSACECLTQIICDRQVAYDIEV